MGAVATTSDPIPDNAQPTPDEIAKKPWKYIGIKGYSEFLASEDDLLIFRRFGALNTRILLVLQDEVSVLEQQLNDMDTFYSDKNGEDYNNGTFRDDMPDRADLLNHLREKLYQYNKFLLQQSRVQKFPVAPRRDVKSIRNWHFNHDYRAIAQEEQKYLEKDKDLIALSPKEKSAVRQALDGSLRLRTLPIWKHREDDVPEHDSDNLKYYSDKRMDQFASAVVVLIGVGMLISPIWVLQATSEFQSKLIVITVFISVFLIVVSAAMTTRPFEALAATAGYAAVLMVFIQIDQ